METATSIEECTLAAAQLLKSQRRSILGIAGPPAAGKSTFASYLVDRLRREAKTPGEVQLLPMDGFHLPNEILDERGHRNIKGAPITFDVEAYIELLANVANYPDQEWFAPGFSRATDAPVPNEHCISPKARLVITEGNYLLLDGPWAPIRKFCAEIWFLDVDIEVQRARLFKRQTEEIGRSPEEAIEFLERSDLGNAHIIRTQSTPADRYVRLDEEAPMATEVDGGGSASLDS